MNTSYESLFQRYKVAQRRISRRKAELTKIRDDLTLFEKFENVTFAVDAKDVIYYCFGVLNAFVDNGEDFYEAITAKQNNDYIKGHVARVFFFFSDFATRKRILLPPHDQEVANYVEGFMHRLRSELREANIYAKAAPFLSELSELALKDIDSEGPASLDFQNLIIEKFPALIMLYSGNLEISLNMMRKVYDNSIQTDLSFLEKDVRIDILNVPPLKSTLDKLDEIRPDLQRSNKNDARAASMILELNKRDPKNLYLFFSSARSLKGMKRDFTITVDGKDFNTYRDEYYFHVLSQIAPTKKGGGFRAYLPKVQAEISKLTRFEQSVGVEKNLEWQMTNNPESAVPTVQNVLNKMSRTIDEWDLTVWSSHSNTYFDPLLDIAESTFKHRAHRDAGKIAERDLVNISFSLNRARTDQEGFVYRAEERSERLEDRFYGLAAALGASSTILKKQLIPDQVTKLVQLVRSPFDFDGLLESDLIREIKMYRNTFGKDSSIAPALVEEAFVNLIKLCLNSESPTYEKWLVGGIVWYSFEEIEKALLAVETAQTLAAEGLESVVSSLDYFRLYILEESTEIYGVNKILDEARTYLKKYPDSPYFIFLTAYIFAKHAKDLQKAIEMSLHAVELVSDSEKSRPHLVAHILNNLINYHLFDSSDGRNFNKRTLENVWVYRKNLIETIQTNKIAWSPDFLHTCGLVELEYVTRVLSSKETEMECKELLESAREKLGAAVSQSLKPTKEMHNDLARAQEERCRDK